MIIDINGHAHFAGYGEHEAKSYQAGEAYYYNVDEYNIEREFDLYIKGLTIEPSLNRFDKKQQHSKTKKSQQKYLLYHE